MHTMFAPRDFGVVKTFDLFKVIPHDLQYKSNFNSPTTYELWENEVANPALEQKGYEGPFEWIDGERDMFGPVTRFLIVTITSTDEKIALIYGH